MLSRNKIVLFFFIPWRPTTFRRTSRHSTRRQQNRGFLGTNLIQQKKKTQINIEILRCNDVLRHRTVNRSQAQKILRKSQGSESCNFDISENGCHTTQRPQSTLVERDPLMKVGLAYVLDKTRYFALSRKWQYFILKTQETGTEHVAIATSKCVSSGIFLGCNIAAKFQ